MTTNKKIQLIKKNYKTKSVQEIAALFECSVESICKVLELNNELKCIRIEKLAGWTIALILGTAPLIVLPSLRDFADLPQRAYTQMGMTAVITLLSVRLRLQNRLRLTMHPMAYLIVVFMLWSSATCFWSIYFYGSLQVVMHWLLCSIIFFVVFEVFYSNLWIKRFMISLCIGCAGVVALGLGQVFFDITWVPQVVAPSATFANANLAAEYVSLVVPLTTVLGIVSLNRPRGWVLIIFTALAITYAFCANARAAMLAIFCAWAWMAGLFLAGRQRFIRLLPGVVLIMMLAVLAVFSKLDNLDVNRWMGGSMAYRTIVWQNALEMVREKPLKGFGAGTFSVYYPAYSRKAFVDSVYDMSKQIQRAHNDYVQLTVELGLIGCSIFLAAIFYGLLLAVGITSSRKTSEYERIYAIGSSGGVIAFIVTGLFSFPLYRAIPVLIVFLYLGILVAIYNRKQNKNKEVYFGISAINANIIIIGVVVIGAAWTHYQYNNINCDKYYRLSLESERNSTYAQVTAWGMKAIEYNSHRFDVKATLGKALLAEGRQDEGIALLEEALQIAPYNLNALIFLAGAYGNSGKKENALRALSRILAIKPDFKKAQELVYELKTKGSFKIRIR